MQCRGKGAGKLDLGHGRVWNRTFGLICWTFPSLGEAPYLWVPLLILSLATACPGPLGASGPRGWLGLWLAHEWMWAREG